MKRHACLTLLAPLVAWLVPTAAFAVPDQAPDPAAAQACRQAIAVAEKAHGIPNHLLAAIARVESGRRDPATDTFNPWPWTINMDGQGSFYETKTQAIAAARTMRPNVSRSIDVGCMQISLTMHPDAFASMEQAFDPAANADYGARFLMQLYEKTGSWQKAVAWYHSATPELGEDYQRRVYAALPEEQRQPNEPPRMMSLAAAWAATVRGPALPTPLHTVRARIIPLQAAAAPAGGATAGPAGHTLDWYRAVPVRLAFQAR
ncbi:MAG TPA: lytic transglycosylase domain-containing protein [Rhodopila sp.]|nr:lytic transglycosylase domain-containing protein [Rhodopila sp.]